MSPNNEETYRRNESYIQTELKHNIRQNRRTSKHLDIKTNFGKKLRN